MNFVGVELTDQLTVKNARDLKKCTSAIQEFVLTRLNETIANKLLDSINILHDNYVGTLTRCLLSLETSSDDDESELSASKSLREVDYYNNKNLLNYQEKSSICLKVLSKDRSESIYQLE